MPSASSSDYRNAFEHAPNPIGVLKDGILVDCNQAMLDLFELRDKAELLGSRPGETFSPEVQPDGKPSRLKAQTLLQQCVDLGQTRFMWTSRRVNGDLLSIHVLLQALDDSESPPIVLYINDISELKASQQAALSRKSYLQELLESSPVAFMVSDLETDRICKVNRAGRGMLGLADGAWGAMRARDLLANPADRIRILRRLRKDGEASGEILLKRTDGTTLNSEVTWRYNPGNNNELLCWGIDITEFKRAQLELELSRDVALTADDAKSKFLSRMSHELRTPLNAILGFGQLLQLDKNNLTVEQNNSVEHILSAGEHLLELIKDVLDFSRVTSRHVSLRIRRTPALEMVQGSIALIRPLANEAGISVSAQTALLPDVLADAHWLRQVLVNLLSNAIKYNSRGGTVEISSEVCGAGKVRIHVIDSGEGVRPQDAHRLFKPFERVSATRPQVQGTGIGLALCKQVLELMGGRIGFETEPGRGSDFWIELHAAADPVDAEVRAQSCRLLYIEDRLANIGPVVEATRRIPGCELLTATDATTGIALARSARPDLIVMDADLPRVSDVDFIALIKSESATCDVPVYGLISDPEARQMGDKRQGAFTHLLPSPLQPEVLVRLIEAGAA